MKAKWLTTAICTAMLVSSSAFATVARQAVLGGQPGFSTPTTGSSVVVNTVNGSLWYDDDYNVFYNPSYVNDYKNYVVIQKGLEGGFFKSEFENFAYGVYMNRGGAGTGGTSAAYVGSASTGAGHMLVGPGLQTRSAFVGSSLAGATTKRPIDLFFGGDTGIKWGLHLAWAYDRDQTGATGQNNTLEITNRYWHFDLGAQVMGFEPFLGATVFSKYQNTVTTGGGAGVNQELNELDAGLRYKYEGWTPYVLFRKYREGGNPAASAIQIQTRFNIWGLGVGHDTKVADGVHVMKSVGFWMAYVQDDTPTGNSNEGARDWNQMVLPVNVALEAEATSWLTLRAGAGYDFINQRKFARSNAVAVDSVGGKVQSQTGNATVRLGSTLKFGKLAVDSAVGTGSGGGSASMDGTNAGFDSQTFALVSARYNW